MSALVTTAVATKTKRTRTVKRGTCPNCSANVEVRGGIVRCDGCKLMAPAGAFMNRVESSKHSARAWTIGGGVD